MLICEFDIIFLCKDNWVVYKGLFYGWYNVNSKYRLLMVVFGGGGILGWYFVVDLWNYDNSILCVCILDDNVIRKLRNIWISLYLFYRGSVS